MPWLAFVATLIDKETFRSKYVSLICTVISFVCGFILFLSMDKFPADDLPGMNALWLPDLGVRFLLGLDGINIVPLLIVTFIPIVVVISEWYKYTDHSKNRILTVLMLEGAALGVLLAKDAFVFLGFWELSILPIFFMLGMGGAETNYKKDAAAMIKFVLLHYLSSAFIWIPLLIIYSMQIDQSGVKSAAFEHLYRVSPLNSTQLWLFAFMFTGFAFRMALFPFHVWVIEVVKKASKSTVVCVLSLFTMLGLYGILNLAVPMFPEAARQFSPIIIGLAIWTAAFGALHAWIQIEEKISIAYIGVAQLAMVAAGILAYTDGYDAFSEVSISGGFILMFGNSAVMACLILVVWHVSNFAGKDDLNIKNIVLPRNFKALILGVIAIGLGLPFSAIFTGKVFILMGLAAKSWVYTGAAIVAIFLGVGSIVKLALRFFQRAKGEEYEKVVPVHRSLYLALVLSMAFVFVFGFYPKLVFHAAEVSKSRLTRMFSVSSFQHKPASPEKVEGFVTHRSGHEAQNAK